MFFRLTKRLYFFFAIKFFLFLLCFVSFILGPLLLPIRLACPQNGPLLVRKIISKGVKFYLFLLGISGLHKLLIEPKETFENSIFISNHTSLLDALYYMATFPEVCAIIKKDLFYLSPFSLISYCAGYIANNSNENTVDKVVNILAQGQSVFIFPEGTRTKANEVTHYKRGAAMIALKSEKPLIYGRITHSEEILTKHSPFFSVPNNRIIANISFYKIPKEILRLKGEETLWTASRRLTQELEAQKFL